MSVLVWIVVLVTTFAVGASAGYALRGRRQPTPPALPDIPTPIAELIATFREFASLTDGGVSPEVDAALKRLAESSVTGARALLPGSTPRAEYDADWAACKVPSERFHVAERWHKKGYQFPAELRRALLNSGADEATRNAFRKMFDEQDTPPALPAHDDKRAA